jgi:hypothetical protein
MTYKSFAMIIIKYISVLIPKYVKGGHNTLHQDLYGEIFFPFQLVFFLNEPEVDYTGGEFVLTEQIPRAQSKAIVLKPHRDMLIITMNSLNFGYAAMMNMRSNVNCPFAEDN